MNEVADEVLRKVYFDNCKQEFNNNFFLNIQKCQANCFVQRFHTFLTSAAILSKFFSVHQEDCKFDSQAKKNTIKESVKS